MRHSIARDRLVRGRRGYTILEVLLAVGVGSTLTCIALPTVQSSLADTRADSALRTVKSALVLAREQALTTRRPVRVGFVGDQQIHVRRTNLDGSVTELMTAHLEGNMRFYVEASLPDTPDAWGNTQPIGFEGNTVVFSGDGGAVDELGQAMSGTVFLGTSGQPLTARAVSVFGGTGQVSAFRWNGSIWQPL